MKNLFDKVFSLKAKLKRQPDGSHDAKVLAETVKTDELLLKRYSARILALNQVLNVIKTASLFTESVKIQDLQHYCLAVQNTEAALKNMESQDLLQELLRKQSVDGYWKFDHTIVALLTKKQSKFRLDTVDLLKMVSSTYTNAYLATILVINTLRTYCNENEEQWQEPVHRGEEYLRNLQVEGEDTNFIIKVYKFYGL